MFERYLDGGLIANNPTLDTLTEIREYNLAMKYIGRESEVHEPTVVVSVGTGSIPVTEVSDTDVLISMIVIANFDYAFNKRMKFHVG